MCLGVIAFLAGVLVFHMLPELPHRGWSLALPVVFTVLLFIPRLRLPAWGIAGFLWALLLALPPSLFPMVLEGVDLTVEGWIASIPKHGGRSTHFEFTVAQAQHDDQRLEVLTEQRLRLSWWDRLNDSSRSRESPVHSALRVGDRWRLTVRLRRPHGFRNPGGFDYERWLYAKGIVATGTVRIRPTPHLLIHADRYPLDRYRQYVAERFSQQLAGNPFTGVLTALAVGEKSGITPWQWDVFQRTGTVHLMAISGAHIGLIAGMVLVLFQGIWCRIPALALRCPAPLAASLAAWVGAGGYVLLSGLSVPSQRAFLMLTVVVMAQVTRRPVAIVRIVALVLLLVLVVDPGAPLQVGFWLSFVAVAAILYWVTGHQYRSRPLLQAVRLQWGISLALLPFMLMYFQQFPLISPVANLIAIPWVACTVLPLDLLAVLAGLFSTTLQSMLLALAALTMEGLWQVLLWLDQWSDMVLYRPAPPLWVFLLALLGIVLLLSPRGLPGRWLGVPLCLPLLYPPVAVPVAGGFWFTLLDVGEGLAAVVRTRNHVLVYDTGARLGANLDAGQVVLTPFLRQWGLDQVDILIVSHADRQHTGGVRSLRTQWPIVRILTSSLQHTPIDGAEICRSGQYWEWDGVQFRVLHPPINSDFSGNNASCVLQVNGVAGRVLLAGDIETAAETDLVAHYGSGLAAEVLVAPHQGRRNLSTAAFLKAVRPHYILFATGYHNRYGYPRAETISRYRATGAVLLDAAYEGALTFRMEPGKLLMPERHRHDERRYWTAP
ncbi:MAG: DNA internalization-related competence protein ComEC/Rec2 [Candidatus Contendobacter odensis]|uniref:DNA internalization-related competence protein ComEC/Rec2 n=1 Tax=Candidatus Contendibacter odensensis TaxID=1400860 RepID=A0A2G6PHG5_9GAMM|nr:MAG: DNA internalization-related competence protein ComEC/Rec2 [Candidatus Contendobacter odensis]